MGLSELGFSKLNVLLLSYWKNRILELKNTFPSLSFTHVFKEFNVEADELSKKVVEPLEYLFLFE